MLCETGVIRRKVNFMETAIQEYMKKSMESHFSALKRLEKNDENMKKSLNMFHGCCVVCNRFTDEDTVKRNGEYIHLSCVKGGDV